MKKIIASTCIIGSFLLYTLLKGFTKDTSSNTSVTTTQTLVNSNKTTASTTVYKDGTYTGSRANAYYGYIQVQTTISNGKITDVQFLEYPNDHRESIEINTRAMPILRQEAITAQSANVNIVSRATDSSQAFIESLSQALQQAKS